MNWFKNLSLSTLLTTTIVVWAVLFYLIHGMAVVFYLTLHACTTGVFSFLILRKMKQHRIR